MLIVTSIPPKSENSVNAIKTWHKYGKVFSLNSEREIDIVKVEDYEGVTFIPTHRIIEWNGRPLVSINALIDFGIEKGESILIINSDIIIGTLPELNQDGITIFTRCDYDDNEIAQQGRLYEHGFDTFYVPNQLLKKIPPNIYCLGNTWYDYFLPYIFLINGIKVYWPQGKHIFHKMHPFAWDFDEWVFMAEFFKLYFKVDKHIQLEHLAINILSEIKNRVIK